MCGFAGIFDLHGQRPIDHRRLNLMNARIAHRGPDGSGDHLAPGIGLTHRRLAIIDLVAGEQPLFNEDGSVCVVYNGEIYNFPDLMRQLQDSGHQFRTRCDTEVIVHAWEEWGEDCLSRFQGMFAFALWDAKKQALFLARDRFGEKPLYHTVTDDGLLVFGSEIGAVLAALPSAPGLDPQAIEDYFAFGYIPDPKSIYAGIRKLPPASFVSVRRGAGMPSPASYWDLTFADAADAPVADLIGEFGALFGDAVRQRMIADVPLGAFLSGGVDSSAIVSYMADASPQPVRTCTISFDDPAIDETRFASLVAERYGTDHAIKTVDSNAFPLIDRIVDVYGEPFADSSALPTYIVCALARSQVKVVLSGDGGDEVFGGYRRHAFHLREEQVKRVLPSAVRRPLFGVLARVYPKLDNAPRFLRARATFEALAQDAVGGYFRAVTILPTPLRRTLYSGDLQRRLGGYEAVDVLRDHAAKCGSRDPLARVQYLDIKTWLPGDMLTKVDRASMANGLEVRTPFLDHRLVEWAVSLSARHKVRGFEGKWLVKQALADRVPHDCLYRQKQGFSVPLRRWLTAELAQRVQSLVDGSPLMSSGLFDRRGVLRLVEAHLSGRRDYSRALWSLLMFATFLEPRSPAGDSESTVEEMPPPGSRSVPGDQRDTGRLRAGRRATASPIAAP